MGTVDAKLYTTGAVAKLSGLSIQCIIRCLDRGDLKGFRIPGSKHRRVTQEALDEFLKFMKVK